MSERHIEMSDLVDRLVELAAWCEQHSYECPVTARDDLMAAAFQLAEIERLRAIEKNLREANHRWEEESQKLRECLRAVGSDGSPYDSVFSEAIALLTHWRSEMDRFGLGYWEQKTEIERLQSERDEAREAARSMYEVMYPLAEDYYVQQFENAKRRWPWLEEEK